MKKKNVVKIAIPVLALAIIGFFVISPPPPLDFRTVKAGRGDLVSTVSATGSLAAVVTVQVGTQVSGTIQKLFVDYNSAVKEGQAIALIDPALPMAKVEETRGNYLAAVASLEKAKADVVDAKRNLERINRLLQGGIIAQADYDQAETKYLQAQAALKMADGGVTQSSGAHKQAQKNLEYCTIKSPTNGTVVSRSVDVGQTVAASFQTPTLFVIAQDLTKMEIQTSVDEADISKVKKGQPVTFTVDSYPDHHFTGVVTLVRNAPVMTQNVVTYIVIVNVENKDLKLKPGMTANVTIEVERKVNALKVPGSALRFKPKTEKEQTAKTTVSGTKGKKESGSFVYILGPDKRPRKIPVTTGVNADSQVEIVSGALKENDDVIIEQLSARNKKDGDNKEATPPGGGGGPPKTGGPGF